MWLISKYGFYSTVCKPEDDAEHTVTIRARVKNDLVALKKNFLPHLGKISGDKGTDYKYRARASQADFAIALLRMALDINYDNFKDAVADRQGMARSNLYHEVWDTLYQLQTSKTDFCQNAMPDTDMENPGEDAYGGILFDGKGRILLCKPTDEFDGYAWTFAKGRVKNRETAQQTAIREVLEETGYHAEIIGMVPGTFQGGTGSNEYFLMHPTGKPGLFDESETEAVKWASSDKAATWIGKTRNEAGRDRDLQVLVAAGAAYSKQ